MPTRHPAPWALIGSLLLAACATQPLGDQAQQPPASATSTASVPAAALPRAAEAAQTTMAPSGAVAVNQILMPGTGEFVKASPAPPPRPPRTDSVALNFEGADLRQVVATVLGTILEENYSVHPAVQGTVTVRTARPVPRDALLPVLDTLLRQNGATLVREPGLIKVMPVALAIRGSAAMQLAPSGVPLPAGLSVQVVPLQWVSAREMWKLLEPIVTDPAVVRIDDVRNLIIVAGTEHEIRHLFDTVEMFDVDYMAGMSVGLFNLRSADARAVAQEVSMLFGDLQNGPLAGMVRIIAVERLNGLLVVSTQREYLERARMWIERFDRTSTGTGGRSLHVYRMQNGKAENVAKLLNDVFGQAGPRVPSEPTVIGIPATVESGGRPPTPPSPTLSAPSTTRPGASSLTSAVATAARQAPATATIARGSAGLVQAVQVIADKENNSIVVLAAPGDYDVIESAIKRLDVVQRQVLVEVTLAEVTLTGELQFGIDWFLNPRDGGRVTGRLAGSSATSIVPPASPSDVPGGRGLTLIRRLSSGQIGAILNLLETDSRARIVANPTATVADNHPATIRVGNRVPVKAQTQSVIAGTLLESIQYVETGVLLEVTPRINSGARVTLEIAVEVSQARVNQSSNIDSPEISNRSAKSMVTTGSGETVVLAGLIRQDNTNDSAGLPVLAKAPVIGGLFGTQAKKDVRTELVVLITPRVISEETQARDVAEELMRKVPLLDDVLTRPAPARSASPQKAQ